MTAHSNRPQSVRREAILAAYSHAASNPVAEWSYVHPEFYVAGAVFLLTLALPFPTLAAVLALVIAGGMIGAGVVLSLRDAHGTCEQIIADVRDREGTSDGC